MSWIFDGLGLDLNQQTNVTDAAGTEQQEIEQNLFISTTTYRPPFGFFGFSQT